MLNYDDYVKEVWDEESYEVDGMSIGDMPTSIQEAYKESLNRDVGSLHEEYC